MSSKKEDLNIIESSDFACLLELMMPLKDVPEYACLPELFSILGYEKLLLLAKYAGGTEIRIPTLNELSDVLEALQWYYDIFIVKKKKLTHSPFKYRPLILKLEEYYHNALSDTSDNK